MLVFLVVIETEALVASTPIITFIVVLVAVFFSDLEYPCRLPVQAEPLHLLLVVLLHTFNALHELVDVELPWHHHRATHLLIITTVRVEVLIIDNTIDNDPIDRVFSTARHVDMTKDLLGLLA